MTAKTSFGQWLKQRRKTLDITREDLAQRIGCAAVTLYKIEADERRPSKQIAELLAEHLNIPPDEQAEFVRFARAESAASAAPWGTPFHPPTNLPTQPTVLIGRDEDVAAIHRRLLQPETRLLTLTGPPGIGKTRLALQVAAQALDDFADGVFFIALAPISDANLVATTIATTLGVPDVGPRTPLERLKAFLHDKQTLLVLDNFEQILTAAAPIADLLAACPWLKLLVTSRSPLRIRQERQFPVSPLAVPDLARLPDVEGVTRYSAVTLFLERAQAVRPDFSLTHDNAPTIAGICARLDGLPLAIELISARVKLLSPAALLERLHGRLMLQSDGLRDIEPRHRTLNAAIDWSYQLLNAEEQVLFWRLGVFVGGWTLEAAEAICANDVGAQGLAPLHTTILDGMASLLDKNLIKQDPASEGEPRFMMLETIREYALEQGAARGDLDNLRQRHTDYFLKLADDAEAHVFGHEQIAWFDRMDVELDNLRAALTWSRGKASGETRLRLVLALCVFWDRRGHFREGRSWLAGVLTRQEEDISSDPLTGQHRALRARALHWQAEFSQWQGDSDAAQPLYEESLELFRELGDTERIAETLADLGTQSHMRGDYERSALLLEESMALFRELGNAYLIALSLFRLGYLAYAEDDTRRACALWEECLIGARAEDDTYSIAAVLIRLAMVTVDQGDYGRSGAYLTESLTRLRDQGERSKIVEALEVFACLTAARGQQSVQAQPGLLWTARIFGAVEVFRQTLGTPLLWCDLRFHQRGVAALRTQLDETTLAATWAEGRTMTLEQAAAYALEDVTPPA
jgi:predicted ATPase/DNA-binding XRE family transcriptional regulator